MSDAPVKSPLIWAVHPEDRTGLSRRRKTKATRASSKRHSRAASCSSLGSQWSRVLLSALCGGHACRGSQRPPTSGWSHFQKVLGAQEEDTQDPGPSLDFFFLTQPSIPRAPRPAASAEKPTQRPGDMGRKQKCPVLGVCQLRGREVGRRCGRLGTAVGLRTLASQRDSAVSRLCWLGRAPPHYERPQAGVNRDRKEKSKLRKPRAYALQSKCF